MEEQLAGTGGLVIEVGALLVGGDMHPLEPGLASRHADVPLAYARPAAADRFDLGAGEREPRLEPLLDGVVMERLAVHGHRGVVARWPLTLPRHAQPLLYYHTHICQDVRLPFWGIL